MGKASRDKGNRVEREIVALLQSFGLGAERVPLSGSARNSFGGRDVSVPVLGKDKSIEVKARKDGFREIYGWIEPVDYLVLKANHKKPLIVLRLSDAAEIAIAAENKK